MLLENVVQGLEFDHVFMCGVEDALLPTPGSLDDTNLFYVGSTRARKSLTLTHVNERMFASRERHPMVRSRFISTVKRAINKEDQNAAMPAA